MLSHRSSFAQADSSVDYKQPDPASNRLATLAYASHGPDLTSIKPLQGAPISRPMKQL